MHDSGQEKKGKMTYVVGRISSCTQISQQLAGKYKRKIKY